MAMTPDQMIQMFHQQAELCAQCLNSALAASNPPLAVTNIRQGFIALHMQGLMQWRCNLASPVSKFHEAIEFLKRAIKSLTSSSIATNQTLGELPIERAAILGILVNETGVDLNLDLLDADRALDGVLATGLYGQWNDQRWNAGIGQLQQIKGSKLAVETYMAYFELFHAKSAGESRPIIEKAFTLFEKRKANGFYKGAFQTEGGGSDNGVTVDYRLSAILKHKSLLFDSIHDWKWG